MGPTELASALRAGKQIFLQEDKSSKYQTALETAALTVEKEMLPEMQVKMTEEGKLAYE